MDWVAPSRWAEPEEEAEWFEVVKKMAYVKAEPSPEAATIGAVLLGHRIEVLRRRAYDADDHEWVELTRMQLLGLLGPDGIGDDFVDRGFILIDATHLRKGRLLRGPLSMGRRSMPDIAEPEEDGDGPAEGPPEVQEEDEDGEDVEWFEVVKSVVFVKQAPDKDSENVGLLQKGDKLQVYPMLVVDDFGHDWIELTRSQLRRMADPGNPRPAPRGFALIDGTPLGLGQLLRGPLRREEWPEAGLTDEPSRPSQARVPEVKLKVRVFDVLEAKLPVHEKPDRGSLQIGTRAPGSRVVTEEETFDGWAKLADDDGWVQRCQHRRDGIKEFMKPVRKPPLLASFELSDRPGPRRFEVAFRPRVPLRAAPSGAAKLLGYKDAGTLVSAESQTYNGWVRLVNNEGWILAFSREEGVLLHACLFEDVAEWCGKSRIAALAWNRGRSSSTMYDEEHRDAAQATLERALSGCEPEELRDAIRGARALGVKSRELRAAESKLEGLRRERARGAPAGGDAAVAAAVEVQENGLLQQTLPSSVDGVAGPITTASGSLGGGPAPPSSGVAEALQRLEAAAMAGDADGLRKAIEAAKAAGASKREIARAYSLHCAG